MNRWYRSLLHEMIPPLIQKWERKLNVTGGAYYLQRMKTKWGSCNHRAGHIRLNTELVKKPKDLLEYSSCMKWSICWNQRTASVLSVSSASSTRLGARRVPS
jgi:hypothetical protein